MNRCLFLFSCLLFGSMLSAQVTDSLHFQFLGQHQYSHPILSYSAFIADFDTQGKPYVYAASNELGLVIFDLNNPDNPIPIDTLSPGLFNDLNVSSFTQQGNYLYLALGDIFAGAQSAGLAIVEVTNPLAPKIIDQWTSPDFKNGSAIINLQEGYAYLGGMDEGLLILDVSDIENIRYVSDIQPQVDWPEAPGVFTIPHVRGLDIKGDFAYLCNDAGGLRVIDISDKGHPVEAFQYINQEVYENAGRAYNNILINGDFAYIAIDYCGLEVVDISNPPMVKALAWYNLWNCDTNPWSGSPGHTNQLVSNEDQSLLFVSSGDSELLAYDISNPSELVEVGQFGMPFDSSGAWGVGIHEERVVLSYIDNHRFFIPLLQPFYSDFGGIKIIEIEGATAIKEPKVFAAFQLHLFPNPSTGMVHLNFTLKQKSELALSIQNAVGQWLKTINLGRQNPGLHQESIDLSFLAKGLYFLSLESGEDREVLRFIKQ